MKAIVLSQFGGTENFKLEEVETPITGEGKVMVQIKATAFNPIDYQMRKGSSESKLMRSLILGREMSGVIVGVGDSVTDFKTGDEVYGYVSNLGSNGSYAEYIVVPQEVIAHKPSNLSFNEAAAISLVGLTALQAVERAAITQQDVVFVTGGAGGVGSMVIRLLLQQGIDKIYTTAGNKDSRDRIISYGLPAENILNYKKVNVVETLLQLVPGKADVCIDSVGGDMAQAAAGLLKVNGTFADITYLLKEETRELLFDKGATILNISNYAYGIEGDKSKMRYYNSRLKVLKEYLEKGTLPKSPVNVIGGFSVQTVARAHEMMERNETKGNKLVMEVG